PRCRPDLRPRGPRRTDGHDRPDPVRPGLGRRRLAHRGAWRGRRPRRSHRGHARARPAGGALLRSRGRGLGAADDLARLTHARYWPYLMFGLIGVANVFDDAGVYSALQQVIPSRLIGRALAMRRAVLLLSMGLGSIAAPLLIDVWGARGALIATGLLLVVIVALSVPSLTAIDHRISAP